MRVRLPAILREFAAGAAVLDVELTPGQATVSGLLDVLATQHPALERRIRDERGDLRRHVNVFVGQSNVRDTGGDATALSAGDEVHVVPAVSGG